MSLLLLSFPKTQGSNAMEQTAANIITISEAPEMVSCIEWFAVRINNPVYIKYEGVKLSELGRKNFMKLLNKSKTGIIKPPPKNCQKCQRKMDWRSTGQLQKQKNGRYTYQGCCRGDCQKLEINDKVFIICFISVLKLMVL
jgi:hypothetical protein